MSSVAPAPVSIRFTPEFKRSLHALAKKYRRIRTDVEPIIEQLRTGALPGDHVPGVGVSIFKVRIRNTDAASTRGPIYVDSIVMLIGTGVLAHAVKHPPWSGRILRWRSE